MNRIFSAVVASGLLLSAVVTTAATTSAAAPHRGRPFTIGLVLDTGGVNDRSFNHLAYEGMLQARRKFNVRGSYIATTEAAQYIPNLTQFAQRHVNLVIATGGLMSQAIYTVAREFPRQKFAIIDGAPADANFVTHNLPNVANLIFREQQSGFLVGVLSGLMEKHHVGVARHNVIGYMGGIPVPAVVRYEAGYVYGAKLVDRSIRVLGGYSQSFTDQNKGNEIGRTQISQGADILFGVAGGSGLGYLAAAQQAGRYGIGVDANQGYLGKYILTSAIKKVNVAVLDTVTSLVHHRFRSGDHIFNINNGGTGYAAPSTVVPLYIVRQVNHYQALLKAGKITPPTKIPGT